VVLDNLSTHSQAALYERLAPAEARRISEPHRAPLHAKHASWLAMVEIEIGVMAGQCLSRIADKATLVPEIAHWERRHNRDLATIDWRCTVGRAREQLGRAYPAIPFVDLFRPQRARSDLRWRALGRPAGSEMPPARCASAATCKPWGSHDGAARASDRALASPDQRASCVPGTRAFLRGARAAGYCAATWAS
jgi:hypothetical protein